MTAQAREKLIYKGETYGMTTEPLATVLDARPDINLKFRYTSLHRGYQGHWEIIDGELFLTRIEGSHCDSLGNTFSLSVQQLFNGQLRVKAIWFTGTLSIPHGELLSYVHRGYGSIFEKTLLLSIEQGNLVEEKTIETEWPPKPVKQPPVWKRVLKRLGFCS